MENNLFQARKKSGLSQESVAEKLNISRQTISKWETGETVPDIRQAIELAKMYKLSLDELLNFDIELQGIRETIRNSNEETSSKIDWTSAWGEKYPVLKTYREKIEVEQYARELRNMLEDLKKRYGLNDLDNMLVLKDILYHEWKESKK